MHDIKAIRQNPDYFIKGWDNRKLDGGSLTRAILAGDEQVRKVQTALQTLQNERNEISKQIGIVKGQGGNADDLMRQVAAIKDDMAASNANWPMCRPR